MNVDPKQIDILIKTFCRLNEEYREKAIKEMNGLFFECMNERDCKRHNIPITRETTRDFTKDLEELLNFFLNCQKRKKLLL